MSVLSALPAFSHSGLRAALISHCTKKGTKAQRVSILNQDHTAVSCYLLHTLNFPPHQSLFFPRSPIQPPKRNGEKVGGGGEEELIRGCHGVQDRT